jgi:hypothetical protein
MAGVLKTQDTSILKLKANMMYFKFKEPVKVEKSAGDNYFYFVLDKILASFVPKSNPDFGTKYDSVSLWYIEYDNQNDYTNREIGLNENDEIIIIGPYNDNLGFWTDEDLTLQDYQKFNPANISKSDFDALWDKGLMCLVLK